MMTKPRIFRVMKVADEKPEVGNGSGMLGVRARDVGLDEDVPNDSPVGPGTGGMSVGGCLRTIYINLLPRRLAQQDPELFRGAKGANSQKVWSMGSGPYQPAAFSADLNLRIEEQSEPPGHGLVEPGRAMPLEEFQERLAATQDEWQVNEEHTDDCPVCQQFGLGRPGTP
ncbi:MAG: hypothetical protein JO250_11185 [Armatimonadetes bacterium]|nr:hypothetical protein [Armatimonadota bacterium]